MVSISSKHDVICCKVSIELIDLPSLACHNIINGEEDNGDTIESYSTIGSFRLHEPVEAWLLVFRPRSDYKLDGRPLMIRYPGRACAMRSYDESSK